MTRKPWNEMSKRERAQQRAGAMEIYGPIGERTAEAKSMIARAGPAIEPKARKRRVQHEEAEMRELVARAARAWWWPGFTTIEHRTPHKLQAWANTEHGVKPGLPDVWLVVPNISASTHEGMVAATGSRIRVRDAVRAVCELKQPAKRPKRESEGWWLRPWPETKANTWYGLTKEQHWWLNVYQNSGFESMVAYGADEAFAWLDEQAGPRPEVLLW